MWSDIPRIRIWNRIEKSSQNRIRIHPYDIHIKIKYEYRYSYLHFKQIWIQIIQMFSHPNPSLIIFVEWHGHSRKPAMIGYLITLLFVPLWLLFTERLVSYILAKDVEGRGPGFVGGDIAQATRRNKREKKTWMCVFCAVPVFFLCARRLFFLLVPQT